MSAVRRASVAAGTSAALAISFLLAGTLAGCGLPSGGPIGEGGPPPVSTTTVPTSTTSGGPRTSTTTLPTPTTSGEPAIPTTTTSEPGAGPPAAPATLGPGDTGPQVSALQGRLTSLGYWLGQTDGSFGLLTEQAVLALQKAAGLPLDGVAGPAVRQALADGVHPVFHQATGSGIVVDLTHQLVLLLAGGRLETVLNASTGNGQPYTIGGVAYTAVTPAGHFTIFRRVDGWDPSPLGVLWRPAYFVAGVALHGYGEVPSYPASHGCVRVSLAAMDWLWSTGHVAVGTPVWVY